MIKNMDTESFIGLMEDLTEGIGLMVSSMAEEYIEGAMDKREKENGSTDRKPSGSMNELYINILLSMEQSMKSS